MQRKMSRKQKPLLKRLFHSGQPMSGSFSITSQCSIHATSFLCSTGTWFCTVNGSYAQPTPRLSGRGKKACPNPTQGAPRFSPRNALRVILPSCRSGETLTPELSHSTSTRTKGQDPTGSRSAYFIPSPTCLFSSCSLLSCSVDAENRATTPIG